MPLPTTFTGWSSLSMIASPHLLQMRLVRWLSSSRFASEARAVFESSPFLGIDVRPLSPIFLLYCCSLYLDSCGIDVPGNGQHNTWYFHYVCYSISHGGGCVHARSSMFLRPGGE